MQKYLKFGKALVAAFCFLGREKDYGGIHLGVPPSSIGFLFALCDELTALPAGHSRNLPLLGVPDDLPRGIVARLEYTPITTLRVGTAVASVTRMQVAMHTGIVELSPQGLVAFKSALVTLQTSRGDILIAGDSALWSDRLWFWLLE